MTTPVLLITFNRPDLTWQVLEALRKSRPQRLFVFQDGARSGNGSEVIFKAVCDEYNRLMDE